MVECYQVVYSCKYNYIINIGMPCWMHCGYAYKTTSRIQKVHNCRSWNRQVLRNKGIMCEFMIAQFLNAQHYCSFVIHQCTGNIGNIPLVLLDAICSSSNSPFGDYSSCSEEGIAYISFGQWVCQHLNLIIRSIYHIFFHVDTLYLPCLNIYVGWSSNRLYLCLLYVIS